MSKSELEHFERRAEDARFMAENAASPGVRSIHLELARNYDLLAAEERRTLEA